jgi:hypothetical protein
MIASRKALSRLAPHLAANDSLSDMREDHQTGENVLSHTSLIGGAQGETSILDYHHLSALYTYLRLLGNIICIIRNAFEVRLDYETARFRTAHRTRGRQCIEVFLLLRFAL